jgi:TolA-binding protein
VDGDEEEAQKLFRKVVKDHPKSRAAELAQAQVRPEKPADDDSD